MGIFGYSYPPGAAGDPFAPYNMDEPPCDVCGCFVDVAIDPCTCPPCDVCGTCGDPACYDNHGMTRTPAQVESLRRNQLVWTEAGQQQADAEAAMLPFDIEREGA